LVERALGEIPGFVNVGELIDLFRRTVSNGERCGCGRPFAGCPFWSRVGQRAFGGWRDQHLVATRQLQLRVARQRHLPRLLTMRQAGQGFSADVATYTTIYAQLYRAIAAESGATRIVDASKWPVQALALARGGVDVRVIHLVRDVRGVAHSLSKRHVVRPHTVDEADFMSHRTPAGAAARWLACQTEAELLSLCGLPMTRLRYEEFVRGPRRAIEAALTGIGLPASPSQLEHIGDGRLVLGPSHGLSGNPSRFRKGEITLCADEAWRQEMSRRDRVTVAAIGLPFLLRHRWRPAGRRTAEGHASGQAAPSVAASYWPLVSVIVPTRGRPDLLRETIAAVMAQTYRGDIECVIVHDQEPPNEKLADLGTARRRVRVVANSHSPGLAGARNTGLDLAQGDFIATCDDDDVWHLGKLQAQISRLRVEPDLLAVGSGIRLRLPGRTLDWPGRAEEISYQMLLRNRVKELHSSTLVMRREAFAKAGRYDERLPHGYAEDYDWVLRVAQVGRIGLVIEPLADIRKDGESWYLGRAHDVAPALEYMLAKHPDIAASRRGHARMLGQIALARSSLGQRDVGLRCALKGLARWPASLQPCIALVHIATGIHPRYLLRTARLFRRGMA